MPSEKQGNKISPFCWVLLQVSTEKWIVLSAINLPQPYKIVDIIPVLPSNKCK
jgi:hypothetical protein